MTSYLLEQILKTKKITDYLASKGHHPVGHEVNGRLRYRCPLHTGDNTPSFNVYTNSEYENYFCYGCKAKYNIIHLYRDLENVSLRDAIKALGGDLNINVETEINHAVEQIQNDNSVRSEYSPPELALIISRAAFDFLQMVNFDKELVVKTEKLNEMVDKALDEGDIESLKTMVDCVPDKFVTLARLNMDKMNEKEFV